MKTISKKIVPIVLIVVMAVSLCTMASAQGTVSVSVTYGNFDTSGNYTGTGFTNANFYIDDYALDVDDVQLYVDYTDLKETFYLPGGEPDPLSGDASVMDAILVAFMENGYYDITAGWDDYNTPNGGYISDVSPQTLSYSVTYYEGENGNKWGHATGTGWNVAYTQGGTIQAATVYTSNVELTAGMDIIFDVSPFAMDWDTGLPW